MTQVVARPFDFRIHTPDDHIVRIDDGAGAVLELVRDASQGISDLRFQGALVRVIQGAVVIGAVA